MLSLLGAAAHALPSSYATEHISLAEAGQYANPSALGAHEAASYDYWERRTRESSLPSSPLLGASLRAVAKVEYDPSLYPGHVCEEWCNTTVQIDRDAAEAAGRVTFPSDDVADWNVRRHRWPDRTTGSRSPRCMLAASTEVPLAHSPSRPCARRHRNRRSARGTSTAQAARSASLNGWWRAATATSSSASAPTCAAPSRARAPARRGSRRRAAGTCCATGARAVRRHTLHGLIRTNSTYGPTSEPVDSMRGPPPSAPAYPRVSRPLMHRRLRGVPAQGAPVGARHPVRRPRRGRRLVVLVRRPAVLHHYRQGHRGLGHRARLLQDPLRLRAPHPPPPPVARTHARARAHAPMPSPHGPHSQARAPRIPHPSRTSHTPHAPLTWGHAHAPMPSPHGLHSHKHEHTASRTPHAPLTHPVSPG